MTYDVQLYDMCGMHARRQGMSADYSVLPIRAPDSTDEVLGHTNNLSNCQKLDLFIIGPLLLVLL